MLSIAVAMTWEYWRQSRWLLLMAALVIVSLVLGMDRLEAPPTAIAFLVHCVIMLLLAAVVPVAAAMPPQHDPRTNRAGFPVLLYTRPATTTYLVTVRLATSILAVGLLYGVGLLCTYWVTGVRWPILGPLAFLALCTVSVQAIVWSTPACPFLQFTAGGTTMVLLFLWLIRLCGVSEGMPRLFQPWPGSTALDYVWMGLMILAAHALAVVGVAADRRGARIHFAWLTEWIECALPISHGPARVFRSDTRARLWLEWKRKGWIVPGINLFLTLVIGILLATNGTTAEQTASLYWALAIANLAIYPWLVGFALGIQGGIDQTMEVFQATRPMGNGRVLRVLLRTGTASLLAGWAVYGTGMALTVLWLWVTGGSGAVGEFSAMIRALALTALRAVPGWGSTWAVWVISACVIAYTWTVVGLTGSLLLTGRRGLTLAVLATGLVSPYVLGLVAYVIFRALGMPSAGDDVLVYTIAWTVGLGSLAGTLAAIAAARRKGFWGPAQPWLALGAWIMLCVLARQIGWLAPSMSLTRLVFVTGLLALPLAPPATAPLALHWNRHR